MRFFLLAMCLTLSLFTQASAKDADVQLENFNAKLRYNIYWNGLPIGRARVEAVETNSTYRITVDTKTRGLAELFSPVRSVVVAKGLKAVDGSYIPTSYHAEGKSGDSDTITDIGYDSSGIINARKRTPVDDPSYRPLVPLEDLADAHDAVSAFMILRREMMTNIKAKQKETRVQTYDGRRLAEFTFRVINPGTKMIHGQIVGMINTVLFRKPIMGYTEKELKKYDKGDPTVHVYFSQNGMFMPLAIEAQVGFGMIRAEIDEETMPQLTGQSEIKE